MDSIHDREDLPLLIPEGGKAVELGVARGAFSKMILWANKEIKYLYSIDRWGGDRGHDDREFIRACNELSVFGARSIVMRADFSEAVMSFPDEYFDFIYIDGYAHLGQNQGKTLEDWYPRLKKGGIFAGHDYCDHFPLTVKAVDDFAEKHGLEIRTTKEKPCPQSITYPSWFTRKPE